MNMNMIAKTMTVAAFLAASVALAEEESTFWGWRVSGGANFGFGLKTNLKTSPNNALARMPAIRTGRPTSAEALAAAKPTPGGNPVAYYDKNGNYVGYISPRSSIADTSKTWNWSLPDGDDYVKGSGAGRYFLLNSGIEWEDALSYSETTRSIYGSDDDVTYGASFDFSKELWVSEDLTWGVDLVLGLSWMKARNCFGAGGEAAVRDATMTRGTTQTIVPGDFFALGYAGPDFGTWGNGTYDGSAPDRQQFVIDLDRITTEKGPSTTTTYSDSLSLYTEGDYEEWELALSLRPWYSVTDWFSVHGLLGMGVSRSSFEYSVEAISSGSTIYRSAQDFDDWGCHGLLGAGFMLRLYDFDVSCDALYRWCQDDMQIRGRDVRGSIEKPNFVLRLGLGYSF